MTDRDDETKPPAPTGDAPEPAPKTELVADAKPPEPTAETNESAADAKPPEPTVESTEPAADAKPPDPAPKTELVADAKPPEPTAEATEPASDAKPPEPTGGATEPAADAKPPEPAPKTELAADAKPPEPTADATEPAADAKPPEPTAGSTEPAADAKPPEPSVDATAERAAQDAAERAAQDAASADAAAVRAAATAAAALTTATADAANAVYDDPEAATLPAPEALGATAPPLTPTQGQMPDPAAAALEAARIAGEIVGDIESASGAAIVAAAAAGAAIEAARARRAMGPRESHPNMDAAAIAAAAATAAPEATAVVTVRMQRERILRALAEDVAASASTTADARAQRVPPSAPTTRPGRADREPVADEPTDDEELDPVQLAAAAIQRLRQRARTDFAELRVHYHRHDLFVLLFAFVIIVVAGRLHHGLVTPPTQQFEHRGLQLEVQQGWLGPEPLATPPPRIVRSAGGQPPKPSGAYHVAFTWPHDPNARLEILIDKKPSWTNTVTWLDLERRTRWGELYSLEDSSIRSVEDQDWLRTSYRYAHTIEKGDVPRVDSAVEYATIDREQLYIITLFGSSSQLARMESVIAPSLRVPTRSGLPLVTQTRSLVQRTFPGPVQAAFDSTVMVVVADLGPDGRLRASGGGSGVIVGNDGSVLTAYHVLHKDKGQLHDVFVIGRYGSRDQAPQLVCAGRPNRSKLLLEQDLALIKCDTDLDGRLWVPKTAGIWPTLLEGRDVDVRMGQRLWVLGYPDAGGGGLTLSEGEVEGWTGVDGAAGKTFIKTSASITTGNSGGPVVDDQGRLVGIASGFRPKLLASKQVIELKQTGLVRPLAAADCLLAIAQLGWTPREDNSSCNLEPTYVEAAAEGLRLHTRVVDGSNDAPIRDALVMVLRRDVDASTVDVNRLNDQVLSWGQSNSQGEVQLKHPVPVPGTYTVMVRAPNHEALIEQNALVLDEQNPNVARALAQSLAYDPWGKIELRSR